MNSQTLSQLWGQTGKKPCSLFQGSILLIPGMNFSIICNESSKGQEGKGGVWPGLKMVLRGLGMGWQGVKDGKRIRCGKEWDKEGQGVIRRVRVVARLSREVDKG